MRAWHVTEGGEVEALRSAGMRPMSYWTTDPGLVDYYAEDYESPVVLEIETDDLDPAALEFEPDYPSIEEPISTVIGKREAQVWAEWKAVPGEGTWIDSVEVVGSFRAREAIPATAIRFDVDHYAEADPRP